MNSEDPEIQKTQKISENHVYHHISGMYDQPAIPCIGRSCTLNHELIICMKPSARKYGSLLTLILSHFGERAIRNDKYSQWYNIIIRNETEN